MHPQKLLAVATEEGEAEVVQEVEAVSAVEVEAEAEEEAEAAAAHSTTTLPPHPQPITTRSHPFRPFRLSSACLPPTPRLSMLTMISANASIRPLATSSKPPNVSFSSYNVLSHINTNHNSNTALQPGHPPSPSHPHPSFPHCRHSWHSRRTRR